MFHKFSLIFSLLLVSLLTLVLPWAGYQFIRETESALRDGQQQMLAGTARAVADSLAQYPEEFPAVQRSDHLFGDQLYDVRTGQAREILAYPQNQMAQRVGDLRYRFQWNAPIRLSPHDPDVLYHTALPWIFRNPRWQPLDLGGRPHHIGRHGRGGLRNRVRLRGVTDGAGRPVGRQR